MKRVRKIKIAEVSKVNGTSAPKLPKYSSSVINSASGYARATRPANVGQVSDEIQKFRNDPNFPGHTLADWKQWHINNSKMGKVSSGLLTKHGKNFKRCCRHYLT